MKCIYTLDNILYGWPLEYDRERQIKLVFSGLLAWW